MGSPSFIPCGLLVYGTHVGSPRFIPCGLLVYGTHVGSPRFIPCGLLVYGTHVGSPRFTHVGFWHMGPMLEAPDLSDVGFWYMGRMWAAQIAPLFMYGALLAQVGPSRHLHHGTHLGPMLVKVVLYLNLTYVWYLLTLGLVVTDCYLKYMYQTICEIDPCLIIEQNQHFVRGRP